MNIVTSDPLQMLNALFSTIYTHTPMCFESVNLCFGCCSPSWLHVDACLIHEDYISLVDNCLSLSQVALPDRHGE